MVSRRNKGDAPPANDVSHRLTRFMERGLVPLIMVAIALFQLYLAHTADLSPWKGGGFGMFSSVDSPSMRVLSAVALDQSNHPLILDLADALDGRLYQGMRALPRPDTLQWLAPPLLGEEVVPTTVRRQAVLEQLQSENPDLEWPIGISANPQVFYRLRSLRDPAASPDTIKTLKAVRLQWWRLRFDAIQNRVWAEPLGKAVEAGDWRDTP